jgi:tetratricopeptide (TPR) repeat protein
VFLTALLLSHAGAPFAAEQDEVVHFLTSTGARARLSGKIVEYTGKELHLEMPGGRVQRIAASQVVKVEAAYSQAYQDAEEAFRQRRYQEAMALYRRAMDQQPRRWVQRQIIAQVVWCYRGLEQPGPAGEAFLALIRDDPDTQLFDCIPLAWLPREADPQTVRAARLWLERPEPAAVLMGASHLLVGAARSEAIERLRQLVASPDRRIAQLANAQLWRTAAAAADGRQLENWAEAIELMPENLRAGPLFVLGTAQLQNKQWEDAALSFLRVAIVYPQERALAAQALLGAARGLQEARQSVEAARLYHELLREYPEQTRAAAEAKARLEQLQQSLR